MFHHRIGDFKTTLHYARRSSAVAETIADPAAIALAHCLLGSSLHHVGDLGGARVELEAALQRRAGLSADQHDLSRLRALQLRRHRPGTDAVAARPSGSGRGTRTPERRGRRIHGPSGAAVQGLVWAISVFLWTGDLRSADEHTDWLISHAESHSLGPYLAVGRGLQRRAGRSAAATQGAGSRACRAVWRRSTRRATSC